MKNTVNERIKELIEYLSISDSEFARKISIPQTTFSNVLNRNSDIKSSILESILNQFGFVSSEWLLTGKGEMLKEDQKHLPTNTSGKGVPYFEDVEASCSIISMNMDTIETPTFYIDYQHFNDCNAYIPVVGDSMYPQYCAGDIVAVKKIDNFDIIQWGEAYLVITNEHANDLRTIKQVHYCDEEDKVILRSSNPNYRGDTKILKEDIRSMFIIKGKIKRNQL